MRLQACWRVVACTACAMDWKGNSLVEVVYTYQRITLWCTLWPLVLNTAAAVRKHAERAGGTVGAVEAVRRIATSASVSIIFH